MVFVTYRGRLDCIISASLFASLLESLRFGPALRGILAPRPPVYAPATHRCRRRTSQHPTPGLQAGLMHIIAGVVGGLGLPFLVEFLIQSRIYHRTARAATDGPAAAGFGTVSRSVSSLFGGSQCGATKALQAAARYRSFEHGDALPTTAHAATIVRPVVCVHFDLYLT